MVKAILEGRKTQTRRTIKSRHESGLFSVSTAQYEPDVYGYYHNRSIQSLDWDERDCENDVLCPYGEVGDTLWVRETSYYHEQEARWFYRATDALTDSISYGYKWKPSIFMPKEACRTWLEITDVRIERLKDICQEDAKAEGAFQAPHRCPGWKNELLGFADCYICSYKFLWNKINGAICNWESNPWVWVIEFKKIDRPLLNTEQNAKASVARNDDSNSNADKQK